MSDTGSFSASTVERPPWRSLLRGGALACPACGRGRLFARYLKVTERCAACGTELHHHRADDAPPYFTIFIVGHLVVPAALVVERVAAPSLWVHVLLWLPLTLLLSLALLPVTKGAVVGLQWALRMHGFGAEAEDPEFAPLPRAGRLS